MRAIMAKGPWRIAVSAPRRLLHWLYEKQWIDEWQEIIKENDRTMAIKRFNDYNETKAYGDIQTLPKGGYVLRIMGAEVCENSYGQYIKISCDIAEGEYKEFYANEYRNQQQEDKKWRCNYLLNVPNDDGSKEDGWTKRRFKTVIEALEDSNPGYHFDWDEKKFKGKLIGGLFNEREYEKSDKSIGKATNLSQLCAVEKIHSGKFEIPADKLLGAGKKSASTDTSASDGWVNIPDNADDDGLPFN